MIDEDMDLLAFALVAVHGSGHGRSTHRGDCDAAMVIVFGVVCLIAGVVCIVLGINKIVEAWWKRFRP